MVKNRNFFVLSVALILACSFSSLYAAGVGQEALSFNKQKSKFGIGIEGGIGGAAFLQGTGFLSGFPDAWVALTLHIPGTDFLLSAGYTGGGVNANIDFLLASYSPANWFELHLFLGAGVSVYSYSSSYYNTDNNTFYTTLNGIGISAGLRLPLGMSFWLVNWFQIYLNVTPIVGLGLGVGGTRASFGLEASPVQVWLHLDAPIDLGVRFWF